ncbi:MAG TPA: hypothetical protein VHE33_14805 [Acidobacteriaceae bacterium]|nr:hypothetical protein [Acidobacteriaceae bacterium]
MASDGNSLLFSMGAMGQFLGEIAFWVTDVTVLSSVLALIEIVIEKDRGWASAFDEVGWGRKLLAGTAVVRWIDKPYVTSYHFLVFGALLPIVLWAQYRIGIVHRFAASSHSDHPIADLLFFFSAFLAICILEDFLWFVLNWHYPSSLTDLLAGDVWWHTRWIPLGPSVKLPRCYVSVGGAALCLLAISIALSR